jgi:hypothetical protein
MHGPLAHVRLPQVKFVQPLLPGKARRRADSKATAPRWRFRVLRGASDRLAAKWCATHRHAATHWKQRPEGGGRFAIWLIRTIARRGGRAIARLCLYPIVLYFLALRGPERRASRAYLTRVLRKPASLFGVWRHITPSPPRSWIACSCSAKTCGASTYACTGLEDLHATVDAHGGVLLFGSHLGSFEVLRVLARERPDIPVRVVLDKAHNAAMTQLLDALNPEVAATVIDAGRTARRSCSRSSTPSPKARSSRCSSTARNPASPVSGRIPRRTDAVAARALADRRGVARTGRARLRLYRGGNRYDLMFEPFSGPIKGRAQGSQPRAGRHGPPLCRPTGTPCTQRALQLVQLLRFLASAHRSPRR